MTRPRLLVLSPACHQPINRGVYRELAVRHDIAVHVVAPTRLFVGDRWRVTPAAGLDEPYAFSLCDLRGRHGRLLHFLQVDAIAREWRPTHVLVDADPASMLALQATRLASGRVWALTAENLMPRTAAQAAAALRALSPARAAGPILTWLLRRWVQPSLDRVFTLSKDGTRVMEQLGCRATQIPLGFDPALFRPQDAGQVAATRERLGLTEPTIAYFGRLTPEKGLHLLIDALAAMRDQRWQLLVDRFSEYRTEYTQALQSQIVRLGLRDRVVYFDARHDEMPDFMNAADIVVLPSISTPKWKEQYGRVLPEAMACGKIVIGSDSGAIPELVGEYGIIFPEGDVQALTERLRAALRAPLSIAASTRIARHAHERLSLTRQAQIWAELLHA